MNPTDRNRLPLPRRAFLGCVSAGLGLLALTAALIPAALAAADGEYPIRTFVPEKAGSKRTVQKKMTQDLDRVTKKDGKVLQEQHEHNEVEFAATVEVLEVDKQGREAKVLLSIDKLTLTPGKDKPQEAVKPGTTVVAEAKDGKTVFTPKEKGAGLSVLANHLLPRIMALAPGPGDEHDAFATKQPQKVNATWQADKKHLVKMFRNLDPNLKPDNVTGQAQLAGVKQLDGKDHLEIDLTITVQGAGPVPPDFVAGELGLKVGMRLVMPADYATGPVEQKTTMTMKQVLKGKPGSKNEGVVLDGGSTESTTIKTVYLKP